MHSTKQRAGSGPAFVVAIAYHPHAVHRPHVAFALCILHERHHVKIWKVWRVLLLQTIFKLDGNVMTQEQRGDKFTTVVRTFEDDTMTAVRRVQQQKAGYFLFLHFLQLFQLTSLTWDFITGNGVITLNSQKKNISCVGETIDNPVNALYIG
jgi:hypothetical protein